MTTMMLLMMMMMMVMMAHVKHCMSYVVCRIHSSFITPTGSHIQIYSEVQLYNKLYLYTIGLHTDDALRLGR